MAGIFGSEGGRERKKESKKQEGRKKVKSRKLEP